MQLRPRPWSRRHAASLSREAAYAVHPGADADDVRRLLAAMDGRELLHLEVAARRPATPVIEARLHRLQALVTEELHRRLVLDPSRAGGR